jgi:hypothetical protein
VFECEEVGGRDDVDEDRLVVRREKERVTEM